MIRLPDVMVARQQVLFIATFHLL